MFKDFSAPVPGQALVCDRAATRLVPSGFDPSRVTPAAFRAWVAEQSPDEDYDYTDPYGCAFAMFLESLGAESVNVDPYMWNADGFTGLMDAKVERSVNNGPWTFGALHARLTEAA